MESEEQVIAKEHVDWFLETLRPLLISYFLHGYKHGCENMLVVLEKAKLSKDSTEG